MDVIQSSPLITLEDGLDLRDISTTGSILHINELYDEADHYSESEKSLYLSVDLIGEPVKHFEDLKNKLIAVDKNSLVRKKILEQGGGMNINDDCSVSIAFSAYWENEPEPFDIKSLKQPLMIFNMLPSNYNNSNSICPMEDMSVKFNLALTEPLMTINLKDSGLLPGLEIAIRSMLVGELAVFLFSYQVMYGEMGIPPRIKPKADCVFYIKLIKSVLTPKDGPINLSEPNMFQRVHHEVKLLYSSGYTLHKSSNITMAIHLFSKAVTMLHKCRLADEKEEREQEKLLKKLYLNLAICNNKVKKPLKACIACNELNRLNSLWNNGKALLQNAKALRMIGQFDVAEKRLKRALLLCPESDEVKAEFNVLEKTKQSCNHSKLMAEKNVDPMQSLLSDVFKQEVDNLVANFKENVNLCKLTLPAGLNSTEMFYIKEACIRENLFFNKIRNNFALDKDEEQTLTEQKKHEVPEDCFR